MATTLGIIGIAGVLIGLLGAVGSPSVQGTIGSMLAVVAGCVLVVGAALLGAIAREAEGVGKALAMLAETIKQR